MLMWWCWWWYQLNNINIVSSTTAPLYSARMLLLSSPICIYFLKIFRNLLKYALYNAANMMIIQGSAARDVEKYTLSPASRQYLHVIMLMLCTTFIFQVLFIKLFTFCSRIPANFWILFDYYYNARCQEGNFLTSVNTIIVFIHIKIVNRSTKENDFS